MRSKILRVEIVEMIELAKMVVMQVAFSLCVRFAEDWILEVVMMVFQSC